MKEYKSPQPFWDGMTRNTKSIFLAGSIENGEAENWQDRITKIFSDKDVIIINPRRDDWDSSWEQNIENEKFHEQVSWELYGMEEADIIACYFDPKTKSPVTMLEIGLHANSSKLIVYCPDGFWRKGNIDIVGHYYNFPVFKDETEWLNEIEKRLSTGN